MMGVPIPSDMDGKVLTSALDLLTFILRADFCGLGLAGTVASVQLYREQARQIEERLRNLGYI